MAAEPTSQQEGNTENPKSNAERIISVISSLSEKDIEKAGNALRFVNKVRTENEVSSDTSVDTINIDPEGLCDVLEMTADFVPEQSTIEE